MSEQDRSQIEELKESLYSRNAPEIKTKRRLRFDKPDVTGVPTDWEHAPEDGSDVVLNKKYEDHSMSFLKKLFIGSLLFFLFAIAVGAYLVFQGSNIVSTNKVEILVSGPVSVSGGTLASFDIQVVNKNNITLENVDFVVDFPAGTVNPSDTTKELKQFRESMPDIEPGGIAQKTIEAIVYGQENSKKEIAITTSYQVKGSNAISKKQKTFDILLSSSPLSLSIDSFKEITSGQTFEVAVTLTSNSKETLRNLVLKGYYPFGFTFISADLKPEGDSSTWRIGDLPPSGKKTVKITGRLEGQNDEVRAFRFMAGAQASGNQSSLPTVGTEFISSVQELSIRKPFITVGVTLDDSSEKEFIGKFNESVKVDLIWFNNLPTSIIDGEVLVKMTGNAFDKFSVNPGQGLYQSADNLVAWNKITTASLRNIGAGEEGNVTFNLVPRDTSTSVRGVVNPSISLIVDIKGKRVSESNVPEEIVSSATRVIKMSSNPQISSRLVRNGSAFTNTGPIPPKAEQETTYTVVWTADNTSSTLSGAEVKATLPAYVKWLGKSSPTDEVTYDSGTGAVIWKIGSLDTYTVNARKSRQVSFQIALTPSVAQIGQSPTLVNQGVFTAHDDFTEETLSRVVEGLSTNYAGDPTFKAGDEVVGR